MVSDREAIDRDSVGTDAIDTEIVAPETVDTKTADTEAVEENQPGRHLCLSAGMRQSGWAVFDGCAVVDSGVIGLRGPRGIDRAARTSHLVETLSSIAVRCRVSTVARSRASERGGAVDTKLLDQSLRRWADEMGIAMREYKARAVRATVTGRNSASKDDFCYAVMQRLRLVGDNRPTVEWEAIAIGIHHVTSLEANERHSGEGKGRDDGKTAPFSVHKPPLSPDVTKLA